MKIKRLNMFLEGLESVEEASPVGEGNQLDEIKALIKKNNLDPNDVKKFYAELKKLNQKNPQTEESDEELDEASKPKLHGAVGKIIAALGVAGITVAELEPLELIHWIELGEKILHFVA